MDVVPACVAMYHMNAVPEEDRRGHCIPWAWSYRQLWVVVWVLGIEP